MISAKIIGLDKLQRKLKEIESQVEKGQISAVQEATFRIHENAVRLVQESSGGKRQTRYEPKREVTASPPGSPPNTDTGRLAQSIKFDFSNGGKTGRVGTNLKYGAFLEFGTERMAARPWLSVALTLTLLKNTKSFKDAFIESLRKGL